MKSLTSYLLLVLALSVGGIAHAQEATEPAPAVEATAETAPAEATATEAAAAPAEAAAPAVAPSIDKGDTAWMIVATLLVIMMTVPGLALFYGGMVRAKNMLSILMQVFATFSLLTVLWVVYGYSVAFTEGGPFFGGLSKVLLKGVDTSSMAATWSKGVYIPEYIYIAFQATFAAITPCLIVGAFAERMKFSAVLLFMVLWFTFSYLPIAHMVWYWAGPDMYTDAEAGAKATATAGYLFQKGAMDFAGGTVVHINAGIAGLVAAIMLGRRVGFGKEAFTPHSMTMTMIGASLLWVGWFGFNVGSNLEATGLAALAFINTFVATAMAAVSWMLVEWIFRGKPSMLGAASGAVAGLVAITPACGFIGPVGAIILGFIVSPACYIFVSKVKSMFGYDDSLDVFGVHCIGGIIGALGTGIFAAPSLGGQSWYDYVANAAGEFSISGQFMTQLTAVVVSLAWSATVTIVALLIVRVVVGLRVSQDVEREGLDVNEHGEPAYHM